MNSILADRFELRNEMARGAVGIVWRGIDRVSGEPVAVKILREEMRSEPKIVEGFLAEAEILNSIDHPGVVGVHDFIVTDAVLAIVLELVEGPDLREHLRRHGPLPAAEAALRCAAAAETLASVHTSGYLHGDVKPGNLMLDGDDGVKFIDFGIARAAESTSMPSHGTPEYTAPEIAAGDSACPASDNYALGLVLYEALTGHSAYRGGSITEVLDRHLSKMPVRPEAVADELWDVVETLLALDPRSRGNLDHIAAELRRLAPDLSGTATAPIEPELRDREATSAITYAPVTPPAPQITADQVTAAETGPRRRGLALAGAGALGLAAVGAFVLFALSGPEPDDGSDVADPTGGEETTAPAEPSDAPSEPVEDEPSGEPQTPETEETETDSDAPGAETADLSDSDDGGSESDDSNEGNSVNELPGSDVIGSTMPGN